MSVDKLPAKADRNCPRFSFYDYFLFFSFLFVLFYFYFYFIFYFFISDCKTSIQIWLLAHTIWPYNPVRRLGVKERTVAAKRHHSVYSADVIEQASLYQDRFHDAKYASLEHVR